MPQSIVFQVNFSSIIAAIEDPAVLKQILTHLETRAESTRPTPHSPRVPPKAVSLDGSWLMKH